MTENILIVSGIIFWIAFILYLLISLSNKKFLFGKTKSLILGKGLKESIDKFVNEFPNKIQKQTISDLSYSVISRITRSITIPLLLTVGIGIIPYYFLIQQNRLINKQNELFDSQNNLLEADRRSSLVFLMSNILDRLDDEIQLQDQKMDSIEFRYNLSSPLTSRIIALSRSLRPYRILDGDTLSSKLISPERGQLFISVISNNLDSISQTILASQSDFSYASVGQINVLNGNLKKLNIAYSNLRGANFSGSDLELASFENSDFTEPYRKPPYTIRIDETRGAGFSRCNLTMTDFEGAQLRSADFRNSELFGTRLSHTDLREAYFDSTELRWVQFANADLSYASFKNCIFHAVIFTGANLAEADLSNCVFSTFGMAYNGEESKLTELSFEQLVVVRSLYNVKNLKKELRERLAKEKPCLFIKGGCKDEE